MTDDNGEETGGVEALRMVSVAPEPEMDEVEVTPYPPDEVEGGMLSVVVGGYDNCIKLMFSPEQAEAFARKVADAVAELEQDGGGS